MASSKNQQQYWQQVYSLEELRVSGIITKQRISQFEGGAFPSGKCNLMASSNDGKFIFLAVSDAINVYAVPEFSSKTPPNPSTIFPFNPVRVLRPTPTQNQKIQARNPSNPIYRHIYNSGFVFNHVRSGWIGGQESLVAVGEFGVILVWNLGDLDEEPVMLEPADYDSTWGIAMSPNSFLLATSSNSHSITLFHFPTRRVIYHEDSNNANNNVHTHNIPCLDFSPCGGQLVSCSIDGTVVLWSLADGQIKKMKSPSRNLGWLVRFVPSQQYDERTRITEGIFKKSYYHSGVEEVHFTDDDEDILAPYYNVTLDLDSFTASDQETSDDEHTENDQPMEHSDMEHGLLPIDQTLDLPLVFGSPFPFTVNTGDVHLAEGAADTWPEDDDNLSATIEMSDISDYYSENISEMNDDEYSYNGRDYDDSSESDGYTCSTCYSGNHTSTDEDDILKLEFAIEDQKIDILTDNLELFKSLPINTTPLDIFYCTTTSLAVLDSTDGHTKLFRKELKQSIFKKQSPDDWFSSGMQFLPDRLAMGEWIGELGIFLIVDCNGRLFVSSPKISKASQQLDLDATIMVPDTLNTTPEIIGYTLIRRQDEEFGVKLQLYVICGDGTFKLYEIVKCFQE